MTNEEAEAAYDNAPDEPLSEAEIDEAVRFATDAERWRKRAEELEAQIILLANEPSLVEQLQIAALLDACKYALHDLAHTTEEAAPLIAALALVQGDAFSTPAKEPSGPPPRPVPPTTDRILEGETRPRSRT